MNLSVSRDVEAPPERVWSVMTEVVRWPEWTASVRSIQPLDAPGLDVGARFRVKQPGMPAMTWTVTAVDGGRSFTWENRAPGSTATATHLVEPAPGGSRVTLALTHTGPIGSIIARLMLSKARRFVNMEADGLKACSEAR